MYKNEFAFNLFLVHTQRILFLSSRLVKVFCLDLVLNDRWYSQTQWNLIEVDCVNNVSSSTWWNWCKIVAISTIYIYICGKWYITHCRKDLGATSISSLQELCRHVLSPVALGEQIRILWHEWFGLGITWTASRPKFKGIKPNFLHLPQKKFKTGYCLQAFRGSLFL